jgi:hypothetical protein
MLFFYKNRELEGKTCPILGGAVIPVWGGKMWIEGIGVWITYKYCVHIYVNGKIRPVENISGVGMGEGEDKGEWWKRWIQPWYIWYIVRTSVNVTMYPWHNNISK